MSHFLWRIFSTCYFQKSQIIRWYNRVRQVNTIHIHSCYILPLAFLKVSSVNSLGWWNRIFVTLRNSFSVSSCKQGTQFWSVVWKGKMVVKLSFPCHMWQSDKSHLSCPRPISHENVLKNVTLKEY